MPSRGRTVSLLRFKAGPVQGPLLGRFHPHVHEIENGCLKWPWKREDACSYMWVYRSGALEEHPFVLYQYQKTRNAEHPRQFLRNYKEYLVTDDQVIPPPSTISHSRQASCPKESNL